MGTIVTYPAISYGYQQSQGGLYRGVYATLTALYAQTDFTPSQYDTVTVTSLLGLTDVRMRYVSGYWAPVSELYVKVADRVAGTNSASVQSAAGWRLALPTKFLRGIRHVQSEFLPRKSGTTDAMTSISLYVGSNATFSNNAEIVKNTGSIIVAGSVTNTGVRFNVDTVSATQLRGAGAIAANGMWSGGGSGSDAAAVTLLSSATLDDALNLDVAVTMAGATDTPTLSFFHRFIPL